MTIYINSVTFGGDFGEDPVLTIQAHKMVDHKMVSTTYVEEENDYVIRVFDAAMKLAEASGGEVPFTNQLCKAVESCEVVMDAVYDSYNCTHQDI